jgi:chlorophyllase
MGQQGEEPWEDVFKPGRFPVRILKIPQRTTHGSTTAAAPKPLLLALPAQPGEYPVLLFFHGYLLLNSFYTQLLQHIASHGYIAIAPQMYCVTGADATPEIADAAAICNWLLQGLSSYLPDDVRPDFQNVAMAGHSRGGKVAFGLALDRTSQTTELKFSALVGVDPVDGMARGRQTQPRILTYKPHSFDSVIPTLIVGSGLGAVKRNPLFPPCAPEGVSHREFFSECSAPAYHFVASDYGHMDFLDDETGGVRGQSSYCVCKNGVAREPMRRFCGGIIVAFLNVCLQNDSGAFNDLLVHPSHAPVKLEPPESFVSEVEHQAVESLLPQTV